MDKSENAFRFLLKGSETFASGKERQLKKARHGRPVITDTTTHRHHRVNEKPWTDIVEKKGSIHGMPATFYFWRISVPSCKLIPPTPAYRDLRLPPGSS